MLKKVAVKNFGLLVTTKEDSPESKFLHKVIRVISKEMNESTFGPVQLAQN